MSKTIRRYSSDFKHDAVQYVESHPDISMQDAADNLGMPKDTLYGWVKAYRRKLRAGEGEPIKGNLTDDEKEIIRLKRELKDTQDALEILKKAISMKKASTFMELLRSQRNFIKKALIPLKEPSQDT